MNDLRRENFEPGEVDVECAIRERLLDDEKEEKLPYRTLIEVVVDLNQSSLDNLGLSQTGIQRYVKLPMILGCVTAGLCSGICTMGVKFFGELLTAG